ACDLVQDSGECQHYVLKWYYDKKRKICGQFWYGGCGGNKNRQAIDIGGEEAVRWIENWLNGQAQMVGISGARSSWRRIISSVPQGSILGPVQFNIFINYLDGEAECTPSKFVDGTKLGSVAVMPKGCAAIQRDLDRLEKSADRNLVKFNRKK
ncbi:PREDICTED: kunitz-type serine protease inhibitor 6-like, partial [Mesitornis unicolor]|uniref:kunitz-type serine protease inhibitor 6-like n=1 Tax=Mesitornis unicolor TaxID=54374 RepID=UPI00052875CF